MFHFASVAYPLPLCTFNKSLALCVVHSPSRQLKTEIRSSFQAELTQLSQLLLKYCVLLPLFVLDIPQYVTACLVWGTRNQTRCSECDINAKQIGRITCLDLLAIFLLMKFRVLLSSAVRHQCWLMVNLLTMTLCLFPQRAASHLTGPKLMPLYRGFLPQVWDLCGFLT